MTYIIGDLSKFMSSHMHYFIKTCKQSPEVIESAQGSTLISFADSDWGSGKTRKLIIAGAILHAHSFTYSYHVIRPTCSHHHIWRQSWCYWWQMHCSLPDVLGIWTLNILHCRKGRICSHPIERYLYQGQYIWCLHWISVKAATILTRKGHMGRRVPNYWQCTEIFW